MQPTLDKQFEETLFESNVIPNDYDVIVGRLLTKEDLSGLLLTASQQANKEIFPCYILEVGDKVNAEREHKIKRGDFVWLSGDYGSELPEHKDNKAKEIAAFHCSAIKGLIKDASAYKHYHIESLAKYKAMQAKKEELLGQKMTNSLVGVDSNKTTTNFKGDATTIFTGKD